MAEIILSVPNANGAAAEVALRDGNILFALGANGTGKSSLMQHFHATNPQISRRISAHRQTWFEGNAINMTPANRLNLANNIQNEDSQPRSRTIDNYAQNRPNAALFDLINAQNKRARSIANAVDNSDATLVEELRLNDAPIKSINNLLRLSNLPIEISVGLSDELLATKAGGNTYSIAELSDGERNALLIAAEILTVSAGTLILVDEPERHLHRSIISPLLLNLFAKRRDCKFVISTHNLTLPLDSPEAQILLIRDCTYINNQFHGWQFDLLEGGVEIDDEIKTDLLGARRRILYVEGQEHSLDKPLYSLIFPGVSVIPKGSCTQIEKIVPGIKSEASLNWVNAFGLIDNDRRPAAQIASLARSGIYALSIYHVESIYYHPQLQARLLQGRANADNLIDQATTVALAEVRAHIARLSQWVSEKKVRAQILSSLPRRSDMTNPQAINMTIDVPTIVANETQHLTDLCDANNLSAIIENYPVRSTGALTLIASQLGFANRSEYEEAIRNLLTRDPGAIAMVRNWFGDLCTVMAI